MGGSVGYVLCLWPEWRVRGLFAGRKGEQGADFSPLLGILAGREAPSRVFLSTVAHSVAYNMWPSASKEHDSSLMVIVQSRTMRPSASSQ